MKACMIALVFLGSVAVAHGETIALDCKARVFKTPFKLVIDKDRNIGQRQAETNPHHAPMYGTFATAYVSETQIVFKSRNIDGTVDADFTISRVTGIGSVSLGSVPGREFPIECDPDAKPASLLKPIISATSGPFSARCRPITFPTQENPNPTQNGVPTKERFIFDLAASEYYILEDNGTASERRRGIVIRDDYLLLTDPPVAGPNFNIFFNLVTGMALTIDKRTASIIARTIGECKYEPFDTTAQK